MIARLFLALSILALGGCFISSEPMPGQPIGTDDLVGSYNDILAPDWAFEHLEDDPNWTGLRNLKTNATDKVRVFEGQHGLILEINAGLYAIYGYVSFERNGPSFWLYETEYAEARPDVVRRLHTMMRRRGVVRFGKPDVSPGSVEVNSLATIEAGYRFLLTQPGFKPYYSKGA